MNLKQSVWLSLLITMAAIILMPSYAEAGVTGTITTDKNIYDVNDTIQVFFNFSTTDPSATQETGIRVEGLLPNNMTQETYFGKKVFDSATNSIGGTLIYFETIDSIKLGDMPIGDSTFIPIPYVKGSFNTFVRPAIAGSGEYKDFLGEVFIIQDTWNVWKEVYITSEQPQIILTNNTMQFQEAYTTTDTLIINYFCKNMCKIVAVDEASPLNPTKSFQFGVSSTGNTLTTSDTNEWKQIVIPLADTGYTPDDDFVKITITDNKGNTDDSTFFVYQPTNDVIRLNKVVVFDVGTNYNNIIPFNSTMALVYRTPDVASEYRILATANSFSSPSDCNGNFGFSGTGNIIYPIDGVASPNNGIYKISLVDGAIFNEFQSKLSCMPATNLTLSVDFKMQKWTYFYWSVIGTTTATIHADRINMNTISTDSTTLTQEGKTSIDILSISDAFGLSGYTGHLFFALLILVITFVIIAIVLKMDSRIAIIFDGFEIWYFAYAGAIDMMLIVIVVIIVVIIYVTKFLSTMRGDKQSPPGGE